MKTIIDPNYPVHFVNAWTKNLALCGSGWLQATGSEDLVTCPNCQRLLTQRALDGAIAHDNQQVLPADVLVGEGTLPEPPRQ